MVSSLRETNGGQLQATITGRKSMSIFQKSCPFHKFSCSFPLTSLFPLRLGLRLHFLFKSFSFTPHHTHPRIVKRPSAGALRAVRLRHILTQTLTHKLTTRLTTRLTVTHPHAKSAMRLPSLPIPMLVNGLVSARVSIRVSI